MVTVLTQMLEHRIVRKVLSVDPPLTFTVEILYHPDDNGYSSECFEMDAVAWGDTYYEEAVENLLNVVLGLAEVTVKLEREHPNLKDETVLHAHFVHSLGDEEKLRKVLGL